MRESTPSADSGVSHRLSRAARRLVVTVVGVVVIAVGVALLVLPGPGLLLVGAGLAILATEYRWARRLYARARARSRTIMDDARRRADARRIARGGPPRTIDLTGPTVPDDTTRKDEGPVEPGRDAAGPLDEADDQVS